MKQKIAMYHKKEVQARSALVWITDVVHTRWIPTESEAREFIAANLPGYIMGLIDYTSESKTPIFDVEPIIVQGSVDPQPLPPFFLDGGYDLKEKSHQGRLF